MQCIRQAVRGARLSCRNKTRINESAVLEYDVR
jgi:hypothetical protein